MIENPTTKEKKTAREWSIFLGLHEDGFRYRLKQYKKGEMSIDKVFTKGKMDQRECQLFRTIKKNCSNDEPKFLSLMGSRREMNKVMEVYRNNPSDINYTKLISCLGRYQNCFNDFYCVEDRATDTIS